MMFGSRDFFGISLGKPIGNLKWCTLNLWFGGMQYGFDHTLGFRFQAGVEFDAFSGVTFASGENFVMIWKLDRRAHKLMPGYPRGFHKFVGDFKKMDQVLNEFSKWLLNQEK